MVWCHQKTHLATYIWEEEEEEEEEKEEEKKEEKEEEQEKEEEKNEKEEKEEEGISDFPKGTGPILFASYRELSNVKPWSDSTLLMSLH